ncbi:MAG: response regulator transcription factor [Trueperaceae bacterium]|nr:response regulator transcription factor [Truepera sp.]HRN19009.1 response regulator transcription factor [Trueperaceae bacterium]HRQ10261.1 response regulator transcription factor [Trueperaceae bacterium]
MSSSVVLVIEDDDALREVIAFHLAAAGFRVSEAATASAGWESVPTASLVVLDWMLPDESGLSFLRRLRTSAAAKLPVLMLTARAREAERVEGLEAGADDYLTKPFSAAEFVARVRALLRRVEPARRVVVGALVVDLDAREASWRGEKCDLTRREFELLRFLAANPGRVYDRFELLDRVWGPEFEGTGRTVDQHVAQLRRATADEVVVTVRGLGYRLGDLEER